MSIRLLVQILSLVAIAYSISVLLMWSNRKETRRLWAIPVLFWLAHGALFYIYVLAIRLFPNLQNGISTDWAAFLRLHGYITVALIAFTLNRLNGRLDGK